MKDVLRRLCFLFGFVLIFVGIFIICSKEINVMLDSFNIDVKKSKNIVTTVNNDYNSFNEVINLYKSDVIIFSNMLNFYYDEFTQKNVVILESINKLKKRLQDVVPIAKRMLDNCEYELNNNVMVQQCNNFSINFKSMVDVYSNTIQKYNSIVEKYNEYALSNGRSVSTLYENDKNDEFYVLYDKF